MNWTLTEIIITYDFLEKDYTQWSNFLYLFLVFGIITFLRYILLSQLYITHVYNKIKQSNLNRVLSELSSPKQKRSEIIWSGISSLLFGLIGVLMIMAWQDGYTKLYSSWNEYSFWQIPLSIVGALIIHETYYYWLHRALHHPILFKRIHKIHHDSISTSVWTSFSFHPIESLLQAIIIPIIVMLIPMHVFVLMVLLIMMTISAIINHAGIEIFPGYSTNHWLLKHLIGATHHDQHHRRFIFNYGLYFTFWDKLMNTETDDYKEIFRSKTVK